MFENYKTFKTTFAGRELMVETGKVCGLANGSCWIHYGETVVMVNVAASPKPREGVDFFPLSVDYEEKLYAVGKIPGGYLKEEDLPSQAAARDLLEETGVVAKPRALFSARCKAGQWILVFTMDYVSGMPRSDGYENSEVLLLTPQEAIARRDITNMSRSIMKAYLAQPQRVIPLSEKVPPTYDPEKYEFFGV